MTENGETVVKRPLSEAQLAARRANAQKSTGPKNTEKTRYNGVTHGMRGGPVLPGESQEAYDRRMEKWMGDFAPANDAQCFLVKRAVDLSFKMERGNSVEEALALDLMDDAENEGDDSQDEVEQLAEQLPDRPAATVRKLRKSSAGCLWLQAAWRILRQALERRKTLFGTERARVLFLVGKDRPDLLKGDPLAVRWLTMLVGASYGPQYDKVQVIALELGHVPPDMHPSEFQSRAKEIAAAVPAQPQGYALLQASIAEVMAELEQQLEIVQELKEARQAVAMRKARIDLTGEGKQLLQYQKAQDGSYQAALRRLDALQNPRRPGPVGRPRKTTAEVVTAATPAAVTTEAQAAVVGEVGLGDWGSEVGGGTDDTPAAVTTEAKAEVPVPNPSATTTEAKTDVPGKNPSATTTEAKTVVAAKNPPRRRPKRRPTSLRKPPPPRRPKRRRRSRSILHRPQL